MNEDSISPGDVEVEQPQEPRVSPGAEEAAAPEGDAESPRPTEENSQGEVEALTDKDGRSYDPELHTIGTRNGKRFLRRRLLCSR